MNILSVLFSAFLNLTAVLAVIVIGLQIWSHTHLTLRSLGSPIIILLVLFSGLAFVAFTICRSIFNKICKQSEGVAAHFLYNLSLLGILFILVTVAASNIYTYTLSGLFREDSATLVLSTAYITLIGIAINMLTAKLMGKDA